MRFLEKLKLGYNNKSANTGSAGFTGDSFNAGLYRSANWVMLTGSITGDSIVTIKSGASAGTETTAETFWYRLSSGDQAAASSDLFPAAWSSSSSLTLTAATYDNRMIEFWVDVNAITTGQPFLTLSVDATATTFNSAVLFIGEPKYSQATGAPTVL